MAVSGSNPKDWKVAEWLGVESNQGDDMAGVVHEVGADVYEFKAGKEGVRSQTRRGVANVGMMVVMGRQATEWPPSTRCSRQAAPTPSTPWRTSTRRSTFRRRPASKVRATGNSIPLPSPAATAEWLANAGFPRPRQRRRRFPWRP